MTIVTTLSLTRGGTKLQTGYKFLKLINHPSRLNKEPNFRNTKFLEIRLENFGEPLEVVLYRKFRNFVFHLPFLPGMNGPSSSTLKFCPNQIYKMAASSHNTGSKTFCNSSSLSLIAYLPQKRKIVDWSLRIFCGYSPVWIISREKNS